MRPLHFQYEVGYPTGLDQQRALQPDIAAHSRSSFWSRLTLYNLRPSALVYCLLK